MTLRNDFFPMRTLLLEGPGPFQPETLLGALCDLGASPSAVEWELGKLYLAAYHLHFERGEGNVGVRFTAHPGAVHTHDQDDGGKEGHDHHHDHDHGHDHDHDHDDVKAEDGEDDHHHHGHEGEETDLTDVVELIERSDLSAFVRPRAVAALGQLGEDFDEDEALLAVIGVVGTLAAVEALEVGALLCEVSLFQHGLDPVSKALLEALDSRPVSPGSVRLSAPKTGAGLGRREGQVLRASLGEPA